MSVLSSFANIHGIRVEHAKGCNVSVLVFVMPKHVNCNIFQIIVVDAIIKGNQKLISKIFGKNSRISFTLTQPKCAYRIYFNKKVSTCISIYMVKLS